MFNFSLSTFFAALAVFGTVGVLFILALPWIGHFIEWYFEKVEDFFEGR